MNILYLTHAPPDAPADGARLIVHHLVNEVRKHHTLHLCSFVSTEADHGVDVRQLNDTFASVSLVPLRAHARAMRWLRQIQPGNPWHVRHYFDSKMFAILGKIAGGTIDVVHCDTPQMAQYVPVFEHLPRIVSPHDCLSAALHMQSSNALRLRERFFARLQESRMRRFEASAFARFHGTVVVTDRERALLHAFAPDLPVRVISNGVDSNYFQPEQSVGPETDFGFLGVMSHAPNRAGALWFYENVLPLIWRSQPKATFAIIGRNPTPEIRALTADPRIRVTGEVSDVRPFVASCKIMVCPILVSGGIKNKMLEAMAMGKAIVATTAAADGIGGIEGRNYLIGNDATSFSAACTRLLSDSSAKLQIEHQARFFAISKSWSTVAAQYVALYEDAIRNLKTVS